MHVAAANVGLGDRLQGHPMSPMQAVVMPMAEMLMLAHVDIILAVCRARLLPATRHCGAAYVVDSVNTDSYVF